MMFKKVSTVLVIGGLVILAAGFVPLTRTIPEEETESKKEVLLRGPISVAGGSTSGISFELAAGDVIIFKAYADDTMMISFIGQQEFYLSMEIGSTIEEEFIIKEDGEHTLLYSPVSVIKDIVIDFDIVRVYTVDAVKKEESGHIKEVHQKYTLQPLKFIGVGVVVLGLVLYTLKKV